MCAVMWLKVIFLGYLHSLSQINQVRKGGSLSQIKKGRSILTAVLTF